MKIYEILYAKILYPHPDSFIVEWGAKSIGLGMLSCKVVDGVVEVDSEMMSDRFVSAVFDFLKEKTAEVPYPLDKFRVVS